MRRDDERIWSRVARTVDPLEVARGDRVPKADPARAVAQKPQAPQRSNEDNRSNHIVTDGRRRAGDGTALPASPAPETSVLNALERWWNDGRPKMERDTAAGPIVPHAVKRTGAARAPGGGPGTIDRPTARKLARRRLPIEDRIDLHGMDQDTAHGTLLAFLHRARAAGLRHVIVITGKGRGGENSGVLRRAVPRWLGTEPFRDLVSGTREAARNDGGAGALYLKLRRAR